MISEGFSRALRISVGLFLLVLGNWLAIAAYPRPSAFPSVPRARGMVLSAPMPHLQEHFKLMGIGIGCVNVGALFLGLGARRKPSS